MEPLPDPSGVLRGPRQERSRRTLSRIVEASLELLAERGVEGTTVQDVVDRAGSSVGSFYARFAGKEDLFRYLEEQLWADARGRWDAALEARAWEALPLERVVGGVVRLLYDVHGARAREREVLDERPRPAREHARDFGDHVRHTVGSLLLSHRSRMTHPTPELAVDLGLSAVVGALRERDSRPKEAGHVATTGALVRELSRLYLAYLGVELSGEGKGQEAEVVDFFDVWG